VCRAPGFEPPVADAAIDTPDAPSGACAGGDDVCLVSCIDTDPDCITTCGDGRCVGNVGELCGTCASDCNIPVGCGNGACEPGESPDCFADCGPVPWQWDDLAQDLLTRVNAARTGGTMCPGTTMSVTVPALVLHAPFDPIVREWAWEIAHAGVFNTGGASCNGRTPFGDRNVLEDFDSFIQSRNHDSVQIAVDSWLASASLCAAVMSPLRTKAGIAVALDTTEGYVIVFK
jgi:hypothetical protein